MNKERYRRMMHLCVKCGEPTDTTLTGKYYRLCDKCREQEQAAKQGSLCWSCINAVPSADGKRGCSWSRNGEPVEGWDAKMQRVKVNRGSSVVSYHVKSCPKYQKGRIK